MIFFDIFADILSEIHNFIQGVGGGIEKLELHQKKKNFCMSKVVAFTTFINIKKLDFAM